jgi:hypothetical protein
MAHEEHRHVVSTMLQRSNSNSDKGAPQMLAPQMSTAALLRRPSRILFALSILYPVALAYV